MIGAGAIEPGDRQRPLKPLCAFGRKRWQCPTNPGHVVLLGPAVKRNVTACRHRLGRAFGHCAAQRFHIEIVGHQQAVKANLPADDLLNDGGRLRGWIFGVPGREFEVPGHSRWRIIERAERGQIGLQIGLALGYGRHRLVGIAVGPAMARHMFDRSRHPGPRQPIEHGPTDRGDPQRLVTIGAVTNYVMRAGLTDIEHRGVGAGDPDFGKIQAERFGIGARCLDRAGRGEIIEPVKRRSRRIGRPDRRFHPLDPPAFLIDRDQQLFAAVNRAQLIGQRAQLVAAFNIAAKDDVARRVCFPKERAFISAEDQTRQAKDCRCHNALKVALRRRLCKRRRCNLCGLYGRVDYLLT